MEGYLRIRVLQIMKKEKSDIERLLVRWNLHNIFTRFHPLGALFVAALLLVIFGSIVKIIESIVWMAGFIILLYFTYLAIFLKNKK